MEMQSVSTESFLARNEQELLHDNTETEHEDGNSDRPNGDAPEDVPPYHPDETLPPYERRNDNDRLRSTPLHRTWWMLIPTAVYTSMAVYSWVEFCRLSRTGDFTTNKSNATANSYKAARILRIIVAVATVPMISAVCAWAAAVYVQNQRDAYSLRLRQVMILADRTWMNPLIWLRLVANKSGIKRYGSWLLYLAMFTSLIGVVTYPVQSLFLLSTRQVYVVPMSYGQADYPTNFQTVASIPQMLSSDYFSAGASILTVRRELQTIGIDGQYAQLWGKTDTLSSLSSTMDTTWFAELPNNFNTGPFSNQYLPRVNSTTVIGNLTAGEFPSDCAQNTDWFYASYSYAAVSDLNAALEVCLAVNGSSSPWKGTNGRQDFSEVLYINATNDAKNYAVGALTVTMTTTAGLFELPNIGNNGRSGPLDPKLTGCVGSGYLTECDEVTLSRRAVFEPFEPALPGPLTIIALAMFGPGSWADLQQNATVDYDTYDNETGWNQYLDSYMASDDTAPLTPLITDLFGEDTDIDDWLDILTVTSGAFDIGAAFTRASFLATKSIFDFGSTSVDAQVMYNDSAIEQISLPSLSESGLIVGSVLFALYMIPLLGLAVYAAFTPRWTVSLDAFAMLRMGAAYGQKDLPLLLGFRTSKIRTLDDLPGVIRDISGPDDKIRQLALGVEGGSRLQTRQRYLAYAGNNDLFFRDRPVPSSNIVYR